MSEEAATLLTDDEVRALPEGTPITVTWSGGNGPHEYVLTFDKRGEPYAWASDLHDPNGRLRFYNPLTFVGAERFHTRVYLTSGSGSSGGSDD